MLAAQAGEDSRARCAAHLCSARDQLGQIKLVRLQAIVALYEAMGGGWTDPAHGTALVQK
jgi:hypothetical protein